MAGSVNKVILIGNLGRDPEVRTFQNGGRVASFSIATSERWTDRQSGERRERTEWHRISVFNEGLIGICERYLRKGSKVYVEGQLESRKWQDQSGQERTTTEVVLRPYRGELTMLDGRGGGAGGGGGGYGEAGGGYGGGGGYGQDPGPGPDDYGDAPAGGRDRGHGGPGVGNRGPGGDLDDEIPF